MLNLIILSWSAFNSTFVANVATFLFKKESFTDITTFEKFLTFYPIATISLVNLLKSALVIYLLAMSVIFPSSPSFFTKTLGILFTTVNAAIVARPVILGVLPSILVVLAL